MAPGLLQKKPAHSLCLPHSQRFSGLLDLESACYFLNHVPLRWRDSAQFDLVLMIICLTPTYRQRFEIGGNVNQRRRRILIACAVIVAAIAGVAYWFTEPLPMNVLVITLDTTRADRLGCYGYSKALTPAMDSVAREGVVFERAYATAPLTLPSHASLFTGLYNPEHGITTNGRGKYSAPNLMLSDVLASADYQTAAFVASFVLDARFGLNRGFQVYDDEIRDTSHQDDVLHRERNGAAVVDSALKWLKTRQVSPFYCWVHLYDPHFPYQSHEAEFGAQFKDRPYDAEIAYMDLQIERLLSQLKESGLESSTIVVIVGDHGEGLGDHVEENHGYTLYNSTQHVPMIIKCPGVTVAGHRHSVPVSLVDVLPTVCDLLEQPVPKKISGRSLVDALHGKSMESIDCYSATDDPFLHEGWSPLRSLTTERWKYIRTTKPELFDLQNDPQEKHNLAESNVQQLKAMESSLSQMEQRMTAQASSNVQLSERELQILQSLGYVGQSDPNQPVPASDTPLLDIKDMLQYDVDARAAFNLMQTGQLDKAITSLQEIVPRSPGHAASRFFLGQALEMKGDLPGAITSYEQALQIKPDHMDALIRLGAAHGMSGRLLPAIGYFEQAVTINPESVSARLNLGRALLYQGQFHEAAENLAFAVELDPELPGARLMLCEALRKAGRGEESIPHLNEELRRDPRSVPARMNLAAIVSIDQPQQAVQLLMEAQRLNPGNPHILFQMGEVRLSQNQPEEAIVCFEQTQRMMPNHLEVAAALTRARDMLRGEPAKRTDRNE